MAKLTIYSLPPTALFCSKFRKKVILLKAAAHRTIKRLELQGFKPKVREELTVAPWKTHNQGSIDELLCVVNQTE